MGEQAVQREIRQLRAFSHLDVDVDSDSVGGPVLRRESVVRRGVDGDGVAMPYRRPAERESCLFTVALSVSDYSVVATVAGGIGALCHVFAPCSHVATGRKEKSAISVCNGQHIVASICPQVVKKMRDQERWWGTG